MNADQCPAVVAVVLFIPSIRTAKNNAWNLAEATVVSPWQRYGICCRGKSPTLRLGDIDS
jgi:hypothetical protein